jgi:hypothetical protein
MKDFTHVRLPFKSLNFMVLLGYPSKKSKNSGTPEKLLCPFFEFFGQIFFQNDVYVLQESFSEL